MSDLALPAPTTLKPAGLFRFLIGLMLTLVIAIAYVDRVVMSVAGPTIGKQFDLGPVGMGLVYSAFFWGYAPALLPAGWLIDRFGKIVLPAAVLLWTFVSMSMALVTAVIPLFAVRILLGI